MVLHHSFGLCRYLLQRSRMPISSGEDIERLLKTCLRKMRKMNIVPQSDIHFKYARNELEMRCLIPELIRGFVDEITTRRSRPVRSVYRCCRRLNNLGTHRRLYSNIVCWFTMVAEVGRSGFRRGCLRIKTEGVPDSSGFQESARFFRVTGSSRSKHRFSTHQETSLSSLIGSP